MRKYKLSVSKLKLYQSCPYRFYLRHIKKEPEKEMGNALILGLAVHGTLEKFVDTEGEIDAGKYFKDLYDEEKFKNEQKGKQILYGDWDSYKGDIERGKEMVLKFLGQSSTISRHKVYSEVPFLVEIENIKDAVLIGYIDGITEQDIDVLEYKTTKAKPLKYFINNDLQMLGYAYAVKHGKPIYSIFKPQVDQSLLHLFGTMPNSVKYIALHSLCKQKKPWHVQDLYHPFKPTDAKMKYFEREVKNIWEAIKWSSKNNIWTRNLKDPTTSPCPFCCYKKSCWGIDD